MRLDSAPTGFLKDAAGNLAMFSLARNLKRTSITLAHLSSRVAGVWPESLLVAAYGCWQTEAPTDMHIKFRTA